MLPIYSLSLFAQLCEVTGIDLLSIEEFYYTSCPGWSDLPTPMSLASLLEQDTPKNGRVYENAINYIQNPMLRFCYVVAD